MYIYLIHIYVLCNGFLEYKTNIYLEHTLIIKTIKIGGLQCSNLLLSYYIDKPS